MRLRARMLGVVNIDLVRDWRHAGKAVEKETSAWPFCRNILAIVEQRWSLARTQPALCRSCLPPRIIVPVLT